MMDTINFARELPVDMMKFGISIAFPGTAMFNNYVKQGLVRSYNWDEYFIYTTKPLFTHPVLSYETIQKFVKLAHRQAIFPGVPLVFFAVDEGELPHVVDSR